MKPVLCVRHQESAGPGVVGAALARAGVELHVHDPWRATASPGVEQFAGLIVLGGEMNVDDLDHHPWLKAVRGAVDEALQTDTPVLGICLGAQTIARCLGANVPRSPVKEVGFCSVDHTDAGRLDPVVAAFENVHVFQWHEDAFELPDGATLLCTGREVANQAFRWGNSVYALQFHCEVDERTVGYWCDETVDLETGWGVTRDEMIGQARRYLPAQAAATEQAMKGFAALLKE